MTRRPPPEGDQQLDFFTACYADIPIRDQRDTMERPFFSLAKKPRKTPISYEVNGTTVKVYPVKEFGIATIWDADILIWMATQITESIDRGGVPSPRVHFHPHNLLKGIRRPTGGDHYKRLQDALRRLASTYIETNIRVPKVNQAWPHPRRPARLRHEAATRSPLPPPVLRRDHQLCCLAVPRVQPQPAGC
jgi:plasmid replication initiation protein